MPYPADSRSLNQQPHLLFADHAHDPTRTSQVRFTTADMTDSVRSPSRNLNTTHPPPVRGKTARLRPTGAHMDHPSKASQESGTLDQREQLTTKEPSQIVTLDARISPDLYTLPSQSTAASYSPASTSPMSSSPASQISNPSTRQKKRKSKKKKVPVTDPNHGKESSQAAKIKSATPVAASMTFFTQAWASSISQNAEEDSNAEDITDVAQTTTPGGQTRQEYNSTQSGRAITSLQGSVADTSKEIQAAENSATVPSLLGASSIYSQIEPGQRFPEYTSSDPPETHTQPWDDFRDFPMSYYGDPSLPELPSRILSADLHVTFQNNFSSQSQQSQELNGICTQSTSSAVSTVHLSPASTLDSHILESLPLDLVEHVTPAPARFGEDQGNQIPNIIPSSISGKKEILTRPLKPVHDIVASSQGSDPVAKALSQSLRPSNTNTTALSTIPSTAGETKSNGTLPPTQLPDNRIPSTQSPVKNGSSGAKDYSSIEQHFELDSEGNYEAPMPSTRKGPRIRQRRIIASYDSDSEVGSDQMHSPGTTKTTTARKTRMSPRKLAPVTAERVAPAQEFEISYSSPSGSKSSMSGLSSMASTQLNRLRRGIKESDSSPLYLDGSESDEDNLPKKHKPKTTNTHPPRGRISRRSESDSEFLFSDSDHFLSDQNSPIMSAIQRNDSDFISDMSNPSWKPKEKARYILESVLIPSRHNRTAKDAPSTRSAEKPRTRNQPTRKALNGRYFLEGVVIPTRKAVVMTQPMQGLREIHLESKQDKEEPSRKRPKITLDTSPPAHHDESDSTEQLLETDGSVIEIDNETERHSWDEDESLPETLHPEGHPDPDQQDIVSRSLTNHESGGQGQVASEENEEEQTSTVDEPGWADLIELWKEHDFQWALQRNRTQPSKVRPYTPNIVFGTIVLKRQ